MSLLYYRFGQGTFVLVLLAIVVIKADIMWESVQDDDHTRQLDHRDHRQMDHRQMDHRQMSQQPFYMPSLDFQMKRDFPLQESPNRFEQQSNQDYVLPNGHHMRMEGDDEEDDFFMKGPLVEHPYYQQKQQNDPPLYPEYQQQHRLIDDALFGMIPQSDTAKCFSCMSKFYEAVWPALSHVYKKPMNFSDLCNDEQIDQKLMPVTHCPTICVAMSEESTVAGVKIKGFIRGCMDDLLHNGFNQTMVAWYRWMHRDGCREYRKRELFKLAVDQSDESSIEVCTCYSDYCNSSTLSASNSKIARLFILSLAVFWPLFFRH